MTSERGMSAAMRTALFLERSSSSLRVLWPAWMAVMVTSPTLSTLDLIWTPVGFLWSSSLWSRATVTSQVWPASSTPPLENCGEVNRGRRYWSSQFGFPRSDAKWERFGGLVPLECERIRRGFIHLDVDVLEVADVGDVRDRIALEVQLLLLLIVSCGRAGEETSAKVLRVCCFPGTRKEKCRSELERRSVRETAVRERAPRATRVVPPLNEAER